MGSPRAEPSNSPWVAVHGETFGAYEVKNKGEATMLAFLDPRDALRFALHVQRDALMAEHPWGKTGWQGSEPRQNAAKPLPSKLSPFVVTSHLDTYSVRDIRSKYLITVEHSLKFVHFLLRHVLFGGSDSVW